MRLIQKVYLCFSNLSISKKITALFFFIVTLCLVATGTYAYNSVFAKVELLLGQKLFHIANTASLLIDADEHQKILDGLLAGEQNIEQNIYFKKIQNTLRKVKESNKLKEEIYTVVAPEWTPGEMVFITMSNDKPYIGNSLKKNEYVDQVLKTGVSNFSKIYSDSEGVWVSGFAPILDQKGHAVAVLEIDYHAENEVAEAQLALMKSIGIPALFAMFTVLVFGHLIGQALTKPLYELKKAAQKISTGDLEIEIQNNSKDEIGVLARLFGLMVKDLKQAKSKIENYAADLEIQVQERTQNLAESNQSNQTLLNNLGQGFMVINRDGIVQTGSTKAAEILFGQDPRGRLFTEVLQQNPEKAKLNQDWIEMIFSNLIDFESAAELGPKIFNRNDHHIELSYRPVFSEQNELVKLICIAEDKTKEKQLEREAFIEKEFAQFVINFVKDKEEFYEFIDSSKKQLEDVVEKIKATDKAQNIQFNEHFRFFHTLKGSAACFHLVSVVEKSHSLENYLNQSQKNLTNLNLKEFQEKIVLDCENLKQAINLFMSENASILGATEPNSLDQKVDKKAFEQFQSQLKAIASESSAIYQAFLNTFVYEDPTDSFEKYRKVVENLAQKQMKEVQFVIESSQVRIDVAELQPLINSCVHLFRNAVDHGIETPEERASMGRPEVATLKLSVIEIDQKRIQIMLQDDGKGVNPDLIRKKLIEKNIKTTEELAQLSNEQIIQFIFLPQFSSKDEVTEISGRGVGLDAISFEAKQLGGEVWVESKVNEGSRFIIEIPLKRNEASKRKEAA